MAGTLAVHVNSRLPIKGAGQVALQHQKETLLASAICP